jgi:glycosyltransferase involved in cell wall biosynthesis
MTNFECHNGISIHRPAFLQLPWVFRSYWKDRGALFWCRRTAHELHRRFDFDAIISFDLYEIGGFAWRLGQYLGIPAVGWATGSDVRQVPGSYRERVVTRTIKHLDLVFYQSRELFEIGARLLGVSPERMPKERHIVLSRGIPETAALPMIETRKRVRSSLGIRDDQVLVLSVGAIIRDKGVFELLEVVSLAAARDDRICCVLLGSLPAFDETSSVEKIISQSSILQNRVRLLPACSPDKVWKYLSAADIFAFASHNEGMPNSLLEAMAIELPSIAFAIPPVREIEAGKGGLVMVPVLDTASFSKAIVELAGSPHARTRIGKIGRAQVMDRFMVRRNMAEAVRRLSEVTNKPHLSAFAPVSRETWALKH